MRTRYQGFKELDRIDRRPDGRLAILDYKTGAPPTKIARA